MSFLKDEQQSWSAARLFCLAWLLNIIAYCWLASPPQPPVLALMSAIGLALISWAAGPRIAQYLGPQVAAAAKAVGDAKLFQPRAWKDGKEDGVL